MKYVTEKIRRVFACLLGLVYLLSGIAKLADPVGASLVMDSYFNFLHVGFMSFADKAFAVVFALAETMIGAILVTGLWRKAAAVAAMSMQVFFTLLTVLLVIFNPNMDCGCFGEAIHLTHWQSLAKNIILCLLLVCAYIPFRDFGRPHRRKYVSFGIVTVSVLTFTVCSLLHIPLVDHTDFAPGAVLEASADLSGDEMFESEFVYEKEGHRESFSLESLPDSSWTFVEARTVRKDGDEEPAVPLSFYDFAMDYCDSLAASGKVMVVSVYDIDMKESKWSKISNFINDSQTAGFRTIVLACAHADKIQEVIGNLSPQVRNTIQDNLYMSDYKTLVTLNRSNGGATYFSDGYLLCKWAERTLPDIASLIEYYDEDETEVLADINSQRRLFLKCFRIFVLGVLFLV